MAFTLDAITYTNPITSSTTDWLCANVGDSITINQTISISEYAISSTEQPYTLNNKNGYVEDGVCTGLDFSKFKIGDSVIVYNYITSYQYGSTYTIVGKPDDNTIILNTAVTGVGINNVGGDIVFSVVNPITALTYKWNFIENNEALNFFSKVDGSVQMATITGLNAAGAGTNKPMTFIGDLPYQIGSIVVDEISLATTPIYKSTFKIKHTTKITPIMLAEQWDDILNGIAPDYYFNINCLKSVFEYEARYLLNDPNDVQTLQVENIQGNSGWFNENFNTKLTNYYVENLAYEKASNAATLTAVELITTDTTQFSFSLRNTTSTPFVTGSTKIVLNFCKAPNSSDEYSANGRNMQTNFVWETITLTCAGSPAAANGDNFGTSIQSLNNCKATFVNSGKIDITGDLTFLTAGYNLFNESNEPRYLFFVSVCNHTLAASVSDRVSLLVDSQPFYFQTVYTDLVSVTSAVKQHIINDYTTSYTQVTQFVEDENVVYSTFTVNPTYLGGTNTFLINRIGVKIEMVSTIDEAKRFTLEQYSVNLSGQPYVNDLQFFDIQTLSDLHIPTAEIRKNIVCKYNTSLSKYQFAYPYLNRWEYWIALNGVNSDFFDTAEPNNGYNQDWARYIGDYEVVVTPFMYCKYNGVNAYYSASSRYEMFDRNATILREGFTANIKTYDPDTLNELENGGSYYILGYKDTLVEAKFTDIVEPGAGAEPPKHYVVIGLEVFEKGGRNGKKRISSKYVSDSDTYFKGVGIAKRATVNWATGTLTASCKIDFSTLDLTQKNWKLTARLYEGT